MKEPAIFLTTSASETEEIGRSIGKLVKKGDVLCLTGDLGAGKTTLVKGIAKEYAGVSSSDVTSPTFTYLNIYSEKNTLYHFDLYRLSSSNEFLEAGFSEFLFAEGVCCIEWPERLPSNLPLQKVLVHIQYLSANERKITFERVYAKISY